MLIDNDGVVATQTLALPVDNTVNLNGSGGADLLDLYFNVDAAFDVASALQINLKLGDGDDVVDLHNFDALRRCVQRFELLGESGNDDVNIVGDLQLVDSSLSISAETIDVEATGVITTTADVTLTAQATDSSTTDSDTVADAVAMIDVASGLDLG